MQKFNNTSEIEPLKDFLGQDRAMTAMEFGLKIITYMWQGSLAQEKQHTQ